MPLKITASSCLDCAFRSPVFKNLGKEELDFLSQSKEEMIFSKGEHVIIEGEKIEKFVYMKWGLAKLCKRYHGSKEHIISLVRAKSCFAFLTTFSEERNQHTITALTDSAFCFVDIHVMREIIRNNGDFALDLLSLISQSADEIINNQINISSKQLRGRIAYLLILLSEKIFQKQLFYLPLTRREIGELINMSTENVIRIFSEFRRDGIIESREHIIQINNLKALEKISRYG